MTKDIDPKSLGIKPEEMLSEGQREAMKARAEADLGALGIESRPEHVSAIREMMMTSNFPDGYEDIVAKLGNPDELKQAMEARGISSIVHSESANVWEHSKLAIREIDNMGIPEERKKELRLVMLYHDLGKTTSWRSEQNQTATNKHLEAGELHRGMIKHPEENLDRIRAGLAAGGIDESRLDILITVIKNHMQTSLAEQDPKKTVKTLETFGTNDEQRKEALTILVQVLEADGEATEKVEIKDGHLVSTKNAKKLALNADQIWEKYLQGQKMIKEAAEADLKKKKDEEFEQTIFGMKLSQYLVSRGVKQGPGMGTAIGTVKRLIRENQSKTPEEIKILIDSQQL